MFNPGRRSKTDENDLTTAPSNHGEAVMTETQLAYDQRLRSAIGSVLWESFTNKRRCMSRKDLVKHIRMEYADLASPALDHKTALILNAMVNNGVLRRTGHGPNRLYAPGDRLVRSNECER